MRASIDVTKPAAARTAQKREAEIRPGSLRGVSVLVVDDNRDARTMLGTWFEYLGCVAVTVETADEALSICRLARPDIVLTDISMPHHDGYWLLRGLRALDEGAERPTPVVAMTAYRSLRDVPFAFSGTFDAWVSKPINVQDLGALVKRLTRIRRAA